MNIVFIVVCRFPFGEASSIRANNICCLLERAGHNVHVIADYASDKCEDTDVCCTYENLLERPLPFYRRGNIAKTSLKALERYCAENAVDAVLTNARYDRVNAVGKFCKKNGYKFYIENCEWYDPSSYKLGIFDLRYRLNQKMIKRDFKSADGFISISRLLNEHNSQFAPSVRIPTIMDVQNTPCNVKKDNKKISIAYTGSPGKSKEFLKPVISVLAANEALREKIEFNIYGPTYDKVLLNIGGEEELLKKAGSSVAIHGRIPQGDIHVVLMNSDFLMFLRPNRRSSHAGFPTKLGECMAAGTPAIANDTGDIGLYLKNGYNGYLLEDTETETVQGVFEQIIGLSGEQKKKMCENARETAESSFDYRKYTDAIKKVLGV